MMKRTPSFTNIFFNERTMMTIVVLNSLVIFLQECGVSHFSLSLIDGFCTVLFTIEMVVKMRCYGFGKYWRNGWDAFDGAVTLLTLPSLLVLLLPDVFASLSVLQIFRLLRLLKTLRAVRYFKNVTAVLQGFRLALSQSIAVIFAFLIFMVVISMFNCLFFRGLAPEYFGTPLDSIYSMFRLFTVEGWYEIPDTVCSGRSVFFTHALRLYFSLLLFGGGIIGMSLINSVFVDAMVADNNDDVKEQLRRIEEKLDRLEEQLHQENK